MKRSVLLSSVVLPVLLASGATAQVVNFHDAYNGQFGIPFNYGNYSELFAGQGAYADPGNQIWNGFGRYKGYNGYMILSGNPDAGTYNNGIVPFPRQAGDNGNPYAAYGSYSGAPWVSSTGGVLFNFAYSSYMATYFANTTSDNQVSPVTLAVNSPYYTYDNGIDAYGHFYVPNGTPSFLLGEAAQSPNAESFTLGNVPDGTYGLYLYGANSANNAGTLFSVSSGSAHNGINATLNNQIGKPASTFVEGANFVIFENVSGGGDITITASPNPACGVGNNNVSNVVYVNGFQLIHSPPPTAVSPTAAQNVYAGGTASFSFSPAFASSPTFRWQSVISGVTNNLNNTTLGDGAVISGVFTTNLTIAHVTSAEVGLYQCVITSGATTGVSPAAPLTILTSAATALLPAIASPATVGLILQPGDTVSMSDFGQPELPLTHNPPGYWNPIPMPFDMTDTNVVDNTLRQYENLGAYTGTPIYTANTNFPDTLGENTGYYLSTNVPPPFVGPVGFTVTPKVGSTIVTAMRLFTASTHPESDPLDCRLEGSTDGGSTWNFIYGSSNLGMPAQRNAADGPVNITNEVLKEINFANTASYTSYRLTFTNVVNDATSSNGLQIAEIQLLGSLGHVAPQVLQQPSSSAILLSGGTFHATVVPGGLTPITNQWYKGASKINSSGNPTATNATLVVTSSLAGTYYCVIANAYGSVTSSSVVVSLVAHATPYQTNLMNFSPLAYWPLQESSGTVAYDFVNGYNGTYIGTVGYNVPSAAPANAFFVNAYTNSQCNLFDGSTTYVDVPEGPFNITGPVTVMAWVNPGDDVYRDIIGHGDSSYRLATAGDPAFNDNNLVADATGPVSINDANWHLVAGVYTGGSTNNGLLYVDGQLAASNTIPSVAGNGYDLWVGGAPDYGASRLFSGYMVHAAVFSNALSASVIQYIYNDGANDPPAVSVPFSVSASAGQNATITAQVLGPAPQTNQWYYVSNSVSHMITGSNALTLTLNSVQTSQTNNQYYLVAGNAYGSSTSSLVSLVITASSAPVIQTDITPLSSSLPVGSSNTFTVVATGSGTLTYAWYTNSTLVSGATSSSYGFPVLKGTNTYSALVANGSGSTPSSTATVVGYTTGMSIVKGTSGTVVVTWPSSATNRFQFQQTTNLNGPWSNITVTTNVVGTNNQVTLTPSSSAVFYRLNLQ